MSHLLIKLKRLLCVLYGIFQIVVLHVVQNVSNFIYIISSRLTSIIYNNNNGAFL